MLRYIGRRVLQMIPVFFGATLLIYALVFLMPGDPVEALGGDRGLTEAARARIEAEYNLDKPFIIQYLLYIKGIFMLDFGTTFSGVPVTQVMANAFPVTVKLTIMAIIFESIFGIFFGVVAGMRRGGFFDSTVLVISLLVIAVPSFVIGFVFQYIVGIKWGVLPVTVGANASVKSLLMPAMVLGALSLAYVIRLTRQSVAENLRADYVRTARAKGLTRSQAIRKHALRTSIIPVATSVAFSVPGIFTGAIMTETIFAWKGMGQYFIETINRNDVNGTTAVAAFGAVMIAFSAILADLVVVALDPRVRVS